MIKQWSRPRRKIRHYPKIIEFLGYNPLPPPENLVDALLAVRKTHGWSRRKITRGQKKVDCSYLLKGIPDQPGPGYKPASLSESEQREITRSRVCVMSFVQLDALRPILMQDTAFAKALDKIDQLYRQASEASQNPALTEIMKALTEAIHQLFADVRVLPSSRLGDFRRRFATSRFDELT